MPVLAACVVALPPMPVMAGAAADAGVAAPGSGWSGLPLDPVRLDPFTPPGRRVAVGEQPLHLLCVGEGTQTAVLDAGLGGFSLEWLPVQARLAPRMRVCSYDRAGYGWSDNRSGPRTSSGIVDELHGLLEAAGESGPYLLVGHSFGGYTAQLFAKRYPEETAGLVLVDASHPDQHRRFPQPAARKPSASGAGGRFATATPILPEGFPAAFTELAYHLMYARKAVGTQRRELAGFADSGREVAAAGPLPSRPLVVITRGLRVWPGTAHGEAMERVWSVLQNELARAGGETAHWVARASGHHVHLDEPMIVVQALEALGAHLDCGEPLPDRPPEKAPGT